MAEKEATVFILDLGASMAEKRGGRDESDLDWSMRYVWDKITDIVAANRKTLCVGIVGLRTNETSNTLQEDDGYENISVLQGLGPMSMTHLRSLQESIKPSKTWAGDAISAIVVAIDMIDAFTKKLKWIRKVVLITDGQAALDEEDIGDISAKMNSSNVQLTILGVDFDDAEYGFKEEDKSPIKAKNESTLRKLADSCEGAILATMAEAIGELDNPRIKSIKPFKTYDGPLTLGNPETLPAAMNINVERYFKTHIARPLGATTVMVKSQQDAGTQSTHTVDADDMEGVELAPVKQDRTYSVNNPNAPGGKKAVDFETLAKGYEYGRTAVPISESEQNITKLETYKSFSIVGFIPTEKYQTVLSMGETCVTYARKNDVKSELALSSLIWALMELETCAVARIVTKDGKEPLLVLLSPHIEPGFECLYDVPLPFAEDIRGYQFPPLDKVITVAGQTLTTHRLLPTDELSQAMSDYVDAMDISTCDRDEEGNAVEWAPIDETYNPAVHRVNYAVKTRAVHPDKPITDIPPVLLRFSSPPEALIAKAQSRIDTLVEMAQVKKVPPKAKGRQKREKAKPISGLDVDALLGVEKKRGIISPNNAVPDFKQALAATESSDETSQAVKQMGTLVRSLITDSFGDSTYAQAIEYIGVMRQELTDAQEPGLYNAFARDLKRMLLSGALGGDRRDFWFRIRVSRLGLLDQTESEASETTRDEAEEYYTSRG
ncbi:hypothetical protein CDD81_5694 [Ophiocordyceps australis]|uniref:ATP-dependent DNA helicase II subunit 2 n=1 Tax=Ophiocordyceps australis TaxID=1399860 RepID=A0A2C5Y8M6_9HYPO|nr:hypothetical protein CDD81_5694 [Ophiocordyceps australis]